VSEPNAVSLARRVRTGMLAFGLALMAIGLSVSSAAASPLRMFFAQSSSMQPTIHRGDRFLADRGYYSTRPPSRGDVALYQHPREATSVDVKRIAALAGDRIEIRQGRVVLNGEAIAEPYAVPGDPNAFYNHTREITVPEGHVFVLGDNRANSLDSRAAAQYGLVPVENLRARANYIVWSNNLRRIGTYVGSP
jgi:signal peptidase I